MPIHLPPISRRRFIARSLLASAGLALGPKLWAQTSDVDEHAWALFSDIHLAADPKHVAREVNMAEHFRRVSREVMALAKRPAGVFITGDCAFNSGEAGDYEQVAELLKPLRQHQLPIHLGLGNHDSREHFWAAFQAEKAAPRPLADRQVALLQTPLANWFLLDSLEKTLSTPGLLGRTQLDWLAQTLDAHPDKPALVLIHHNPGIDGGNMGLKDTLLLWEVLRPRKQVKAYIYGHTHNWKVQQDPSGIHMVNLPPVAYVFHPGDPSGWVHATLKPEGMRLELRCVDPNHARQGQVFDLKWRV